MAEFAEYFDVTGVDMSPRSIEFARQRFPNAVFVVGDMATIEFLDESLDLVTAASSITHSVNASAAARNTPVACVLPR